MSGRGARTPLIAVALLAGALGAGAVPAGAAAEWRDVTLETEAERWTSRAGFDPVTGLLFVTSLDPFQTNAQVSAYRPGRATPVWTKTFAPADEAGHDSSAASSLLVAPERGLVYAGGGYLSGHSDDGFTTSPYLYAFDARTGAVAWSERGPDEPGMGGSYFRLASGPGGSVIAVQHELVGEQHNVSSSYVAEVVSFDSAGDPGWRWVDDHVAEIGEVVTAGGVVAFAGATYPDGWARAYRVALDSTTGQLVWRHVTTDGTQHLDVMAASRDGETLYLGGTDQDPDGGRAMLRAVSAATGRAQWTRWYGGPATAGGSDLVYDGVNRVVATSAGPCVTGAHVEARRETYERVLPDDGSLACYSRTGRRRWIDRSTQGQGRVLVAAGHRLLWAGRQEVSRTESSEEVLRFAVRSLGDGTVRHASHKAYRTADFDPSRPLLALEHDGEVHFVTSMTNERNRDGSIAGDVWLLNRVLR